MKMDTKFKTINQIFSQSKYQIIFGLCTIATGLLFSITSDIILLPSFALNTYLDPIKSINVPIMSILLSASLTVLVHNYEKKVQSGISNKKTTFIGALIGVFTSACPVCQPIWLIWLGLGGATAFLADISVYIGIISILFLLISFNRGLKAASESGICVLKK